MTIKYQLIKLNAGNLIVSDEKIKEGDIVFRNQNYLFQAGFTSNNFSAFEGNGWTEGVNHKELQKVIALDYHPEIQLPEIDYNDLEFHEPITTVEIETISNIPSTEVMGEFESQPKVVDNKIKIIKVV